MQYYNGADASTPGAPLPKGTSILFVYIGEKNKAGAPDTPHIWTGAECNLYLDADSDLYGGPHLRICPVYTKDFADDPGLDAQNAIEAMQDLGWTMHIGRLLFWDSELLIDATYTDRLALECMTMGVRLGKYGSLSTINHDPPVPGGTWFAEWQNTKPASIPPGVGDAWQWASPTQVGGSWDRTIAKPFVYANCGRGIRRPG